ncbi:homoserine kinase [Marinicrinis sediminis]|uniref:Homoserine kinase n=1 Tax=Marinicrinis sediminis TaxID=1652465 RepID=A0ABW5R5Z8_9BACL
MSRNNVLVRVPASTANMGPGFDSLGLALPQYLWVRMSISEHTAIRLHGDHLNGIPTTKSNLIYKMAQQVFDKVGFQQPELDLDVYSDIPLTRGMGSSAAAIIAGLVAANELSGATLSDDELFQMAAMKEGHPDNVGAALYGGMVVTSMDEDRASVVRLSPPSDLACLLVVPDFQLSTEKARTVLPAQFSREDAVYNVSHASLLVAAMATGELELIATGMQDRLHQPYRSSLVPGMEEILSSATSYGALGVALSGAGPTLIAFLRADSSRREELERFMLGRLHQEGIAAEAYLLRPDGQGVYVVEDPSAEPHPFDASKGEIHSC